MRNAMVRIMATLAVAFVCLIAGMLSSTFANQGVRLSSEEMLSSNGAYAKVGKCTSTCDRYNQFDQKCVGANVPNGAACITCSVKTDIDTAGIASTGCPPGTKGNKTVSTSTQDCGIELNGTCLQGVCESTGENTTVQCKDPAVVVGQ